jgi:Fic family protein
MSHLNPILQKRIDAKLARLNQLRPLPPSAVKKLQEQFQIEMTYNSNSIEGNSLTLKETYLVISEGITIKNKPLKDHLEAKDHYEALEFLADMVQHEKHHTISETLIRTLHQLVVRETEREWAGKYRNSNVFIMGASHKPPEAFLVPQQMRALVQWWKNNHKKLHPIETASILHHKFVHIHPFFDGNGRTGRLLMNVSLMQYGYPLSIVLKNDRKKYYQVLEKADKGDPEKLVQFIAQSVERSLDIYLNTLTPANIRHENFKSLSEISKNTSYSAKYLNLLVRQGKLEAHKEGRRWVTSPEALKRYTESRKRRR